MKGLQIIGTQRSGSNLLRLMLNQLPDVSAPHPPHIMDTFFPYIYNYGNIDQESHFLELIEDVCQLVETNPVPWRNINLERKLIARQCRTNTLVEVFQVIYQLKAISSGKNVWCCKSMGNSRYFDLFESAGIRPFYLHLVRDGRDVAASFQKADIGEKHIYHLAKQWKEDQQMAERVLNAVGPSRAMRIQYEDLIHNPERTMESICHWMDIEFNHSVLDFYNTEESRCTAEGGEIWMNLIKPIMPDNCQKFHEELSLEEIRLFERIAHDDLLRYQYGTYNEPVSDSFSEHEIAQFDLLNERLKIKAQSKSGAGILKRNRQQELKRRIATRIYRSVA